MKTKSPIVLYFRSRLNIFLLVSSVLLGILSYNLFIDSIRIIGPISIAVIYFVVSIYFMSTKRGVKEIIKEGEEERLHKIEGTITELNKVRDTISYLRVSDNDIKKVIEYFLVISGNYLNKCKELGTYSPEANHKIEEVLKICQIYLEELDETVIEDQYGIKDNENFSDYKKRTIDSISSCSNTIKKLTETELTGLTRKEAIEIIEEMNNENT